MQTQLEEVIKFWFGDLDENGSAPSDQRNKWFAKSDEFDSQIRSRFGELHERVSSGRHESWLSSPHGCLAYIVVLDQFSRNMFRDTPQMFATDPLALQAARLAIAKGYDGALSIDERCFVYMPFMHSESLEDQNECVRLFQRMCEQAPPALKDFCQASLSYAKQHRAIVERFGRFPHRNRNLGRQSSSDEIAFLKQPGSSF